MGPSSILVLGLAVASLAWPQLSGKDGVHRRSGSGQAAIPYGTQRKRSDVLSGESAADIKGLITLPVPIVPSKRSHIQLPVDGPGEGAHFTLPVPSKRSHIELPVDGPGEGAHFTLPVPSKRSHIELPVDGPGEGAHFTLPVPSKRSHVELPADQGARGAHVTLPVVHARRPGLHRRGIEVQLANRSDVAYYTELAIGTPPQPIYVQLDTGSFELWVNPNCADLDSADASFCQAVGFYDTSKSSTAVQLVNDAKQLRYGIGTANVTYVTDSVGINGAFMMTNVQFGVATNTTEQFAGILGIGYGVNVTTRYPNFVDQLQDQGVTKVKAFALGLGSKAEEEGVLTFGGVDTAKFAGPLARLPIIPPDKSPDGVPRYWISMDSVTLSPATGTPKTYDDSSMPVFLDSGATLTLLPQALADSIGADFGAAGGVGTDGFYPVDCNLTNLKGSLDFAFNGVTIKVPFAELVRQLANDPPACFLGVMPSTEFTLLGDSFLRSAYAVFDLESNNTYLAPYANCGAQPVTLNSSSDLSSLTGSCSISEAAESNSNTGGLGTSSGTSVSRETFGITNWAVVAAATVAAIAMLL